MTNTSGQQASRIYLGEVWVSFHHGMPFGATSSVYAWHRVGAAIGAIARRLLHLPVLRYVDDYFAVERQDGFGVVIVCVSIACALQARDDEASHERVCEIGKASPWRDGHRKEKAGVWLGTCCSRHEGYV